MAYKEQEDSQPGYIKVMADYLSTGLWDSSGLNAEESFVPMSDALLARLRAWCLWYESNDDYNPEPATKFDYAAFSIEGLEIAKALKVELPDWTVVYFDEERMIEANARALKDRTFFEYEVTSGMVRPGQASAA